ncbi:MAG: phage major capsid protein [Clostridium sp.]
MKMSNQIKQKIEKFKVEAQTLINANNMVEGQKKINEIKDLKVELENEILKEENEGINLLANFERGNNGNNSNNNNSGLEIKDNAGRSMRIVNKGESFINATQSQNNEGLEIGKYIKGMVTGKWDNASKELEQFKALNTSTGTTLIPRQLSSQIIELARANMVLSDIPIIPMDTNNLTIAKILDNPVFAYKKELVDTKVSDMTFEPVELKTKTIYGLMKISIELFNSAANIETVLRESMANAMAEAIDKSGLYGKGFNEELQQYEPLGITKAPGINILEDVNTVDTSKHTSFINGIGAITKANGTPTHTAYNSTIDTGLNLLTDTTGQPLNAPAVFNSLVKKVSNSIADNEALVYDNNAIVMGLQKDISIDTSKELGFIDGSLYFRIYAMVDFAVLKPKSITHIKYKKAII